MDKPGWRIHAALKQNHRCEGSPQCFFWGPTRPGCISLVTFFVQAKKVTRQQAKKGLSKSEKISVKKF
jgi:hypothetical protein